MCYSPGRGNGKPLPLDPVARFHLRNGASLHSINWMANPSLQGLIILSSFFSLVIFIGLYNNHQDSMIPLE